MRFSSLFIALTVFALTSCDGSGTSDAERKLGSNSKSSQVSQGSKVFIDNCQVCHGVAAAGLTEDWKKTDANGNYPPPPLNGTAHTWHHSQEVLLRTINNGGIPLGGTMPPFKDVLSEEEKLAVLAYIKSLWPKDVYDAWKERFEGQ